MSGLAKGSGMDVHRGVETTPCLLWSAGGYGGPRGRRRVIPAAGVPRKAADREMEAGELMAILRGVDGCPAGWLGVSLDLSRHREPQAAVYPDARSVTRDGEPDVVAIDIPIGLPARESRRVDAEARKLLGPRAGSVFPAPVRAALDAGGYQEACAASFRVCGKKLSKQAFMILPKIRDVDRILRGDAALASRVFEVHPEICFRELNNGEPMAHSKRSGFGFAARLELVDAVFLGAARRIRAELPRGVVSDDDILDALAALWSARRIHLGTAVRLPSGGPETDAAGLPMQMLA